MVGKLKKYESVLTTWLKSYVEEHSGNDLEYQFICDKQNHHFQVVKTGWFNDAYVYTVLLHFQLKPDGKVWLLSNKTDIDLDSELPTLGILTSDVVPAFQPPYLRVLAGYAA
jgi:XisI protein